VIWYNKWFKAFQDNKRIIGAFWNEKYQSIKSKKNYKYWEIMWRKFLFEINWVFIKKISKLVVTNKTRIVTIMEGKWIRNYALSSIFIECEKWLGEEILRENIVARIISIKHVFLKKKL